MYHPKLSKGLTLVELLISIGILSLVMAALGTLIVTFNNTQYSKFNQLRAIQESRIAAGKIIQLLKNSTIGEDGSYPVASASLNDITFFNDINNDGIVEKVRLFKDQDILKKGIIFFNTSSKTYPATSEVITVMLRDIVNTNSEQLFRYYKGGYNGQNAASEELIAPVINIGLISIIQLNIKVDTDINREPEAFLLEESVQPRNLKNNL